MLKIIHTCVDYWVIDKPAGMSFHAESDSMGVMETLYKDYPNCDFYPVHRLDKMTSGILLVACTKEAATLFGELFRQHKMEKRYLALSLRKPNKKQGTISGGMQVSRRGQWKLTKEKNNLAVTQFFSRYVEGKRLFWLRPLTGKTHQIRVALKSVAAPILGDERYGGGASDRGYLHAYSIAFEWRGESVCYQVSPSLGEHFSPILLDHVVNHFVEAKLKWPQTKH